MDRKLKILVCIGISTAAMYIEIEASLCCGKKQKELDAIQQAPQKQSEAQSASSSSVQQASTLSEQAKSNKGNLALVAATAVQTAPASQESDSNDSVSMDYKSVFALRHNARVPNDVQPVDDGDVRFVLHPETIFYRGDK